MNLCTDPIEEPMYRSNSRDNIGFKLVLVRSSTDSSVLTPDDPGVV